MLLETKHKQWLQQGGFSPLDLPSLSHWYDNSDSSLIVLNGANVKGQKDKAFGYSNYYTSDFSAGIDGWTETNMPLLGNQTVGGRTECLSATKNAVASSANFNINAVGSHVPGTFTKYVVSVYIPSSNTEIDGYRIEDQSGVLVLLDKRSTVSPPLYDQWQDFVLFNVPASTNNRFRIQAFVGASNAFTAASDGDILAIKDVVLDSDAGISRYALNASEQPAYANPIITSDGGGNILNMTSNISDPTGYVIAVLQFVGGATKTWLTEYEDANNNLWMGQTSVNDEARFVTTVGGSTNALSEGNDLSDVFSVLEFASDGVNKYIARNGGAFVTTVNQPSWFGALGGPTRFFEFNGAFYACQEQESVFLNDQPTAEQRSQLITYLDEKYIVF